MNYSEVENMEFIDLLEFHEVMSYTNDLEAEQAMLQWEQMDPKHRGPAPYRRAF